MELARLVEVVDRVRATARKTEKVGLLADFLRQTQDKETELTALYLSGSLPQGRIGVGWRMIDEAMPQSAVSRNPLRLVEVDQTFESIAAERGSGSSERKVQTLRGLFERASQDERQFVARLLIGEVRQGALEGLVLEAIAKASGLPQAKVRQAMMFSGNLGEVARVALEQGAAGLSRFTLRLLSPVSPMLANSAEDVSAVLERIGEAAFEFKLDGARIQVHRSGDEIKVFTRQLQDVTERLPEVVEWSRSLPVREIVLEGETIALRPEGRPYPFQVTMRRLGRTKKVESIRQELPLSS